mmetsp:Transcript_10118/g.15229  ORF Transcript_10118/g.15229 Transcript_10118/m.15229 type:complete len:234 (-) Transcript_10118:10-711(-)
MLTGFLKLPQHHAHGTALSTVISTGISATFGYSSLGLINWSLIPAMTVSGMVTSAAGAKLANRLNPLALKASLGLFMMAISPMIIFREQIVSSLTKRSEAEKSRGNRSQMRMALIGAGSGLLSGLFGIGGGIVTVPALLFMSDVSHKESLGLSLASMVMPAISGGLVHLKQGNVVLRIAVPLSLGTCAGAYIGSKYVAPNVSTDHLKFGFAAFMAVVGFRYFKNSSSLFLRNK